MSGNVIGRKQPNEVEWIFWKGCNDESRWCVWGGGEIKKWWQTGLNHLIFLWQGPFDPLPHITFVQIKDHKNGIKARCSSEGVASK